MFVLIPLATVRVKLYWFWYPENLPTNQLTVSQVAADSRIGQLAD